MQIFLEKLTPYVYVYLYVERRGYLQAPYVEVYVEVYLYVYVYENVYVYLEVNVYVNVYERRINVEER